MRISCAWTSGCRRGGFSWDAPWTQNGSIWRFSSEFDSHSEVYAHIDRGAGGGREKQRTSIPVMNEQFWKKVDILHKSRHETFFINHQILHQNPLPLSVRWACGNVPNSGKLPPPTTTNNHHHHQQQQLQQTATRCSRFRWESAVLNDALSWSTMDGQSRGDTDVNPKWKRFTDTCAKPH